MKKVLLLACVLLVSVASSYAQFKFTSIDCPGSTPTTARGINDRGQIVGGTGGHAVLIEGGQCTPLAPTTVLGTNASQALRNNNAGDVVGIFYDDSGFVHGFLFSKKGVLTTLDFPGASDTYAFGINDLGRVVGYWDQLDASGNLLVFHGFIWEDGSFREVSFPGSAGSSILGNNDPGDFVGLWYSSTSPDEHGYVFSQGRFTSFDVPVAGSTFTQANDINAPGEIIGVYLDAGGMEHGFLKVGAKFTSIDYPGAYLTAAWSINSAGLIVGNHYDSASSPAQGYLAVRK
ncbi:MAG: hypothetical protein WA188_04315 [Terriglobales bacterium]